MVNFKWDQKRALEVAREEGQEEKKRAILDIALSLLKDGIPGNNVVKYTHLSVDEVRKLAKDNGLAF